MSKSFLIFLIFFGTSVETYTAGQGPNYPIGISKLSKQDSVLSVQDRTRDLSALVADQSKSDGRSGCVTEESPSLTYAVDTTGSMYDDFSELKIVNNWLLERVALKFPCSFRQYTMVEFNDPDVGPVRITDKMNVFGSFFNNLEAIAGGDCPELSMTGVKLALQSSPHMSFIIVLTDASSKDYTNATLMNEVFTLLDTTKSQVLFLTTGVCVSEISPDYTIYRNVSSRSFGHVFRLTIPDLNKAFHYLEYTLSMALNSSKRLFSGDYTDLDHSKSFSVDDIFWTVMITTDGRINSLEIVGPAGSVVVLEELVSEHWGSMYLLKYPAKGNYRINIKAESVHAIRIQGFSDNDPQNCSLCHPDANCDKYSGYEKCVCKPGYIGNGYNCVDDDECAYVWTHNCSVGTCQNTIGSYICLCPSGYVHVAGSCVLIRCGDPSCHPLADCIETLAGYICVCRDGYYGNGFHCEIDECKRGDCGPELDCTKSLGSFSCFDPCERHQVLDEPWRSTTSIPSSFINCDISKNGWYQFVGNGGVRIPESCVPINRCSTNYPVWMMGTHPVITDGIVNRTACANRGGNCCQWTSTIQVKACPYGFHVYKLIGTPGSACALSYCTDASTQTCKAEEEWQKKDKGYGCFCKQPYKVTALGQVIPDLTCGLFEMNATFHKCQFNDLNIYFNGSHVQDKTCLTFQDNLVTNTFSIISPLQVYKCGALAYETNSTHVIYKTVFTIVVEQPGQIITRNNTLIITLMCVYPLDMIASLNIVLYPILNSINITIWGTGQFEVTMALYKDSGYTTPHTGSSVTLSTEEYLYVGVFVKGGTPNFFLVMKNCYATPTNDVNGSPKYDLILNSCPNLQDGTVTVVENGVSNKGRFSVQMFKFVGNYDEVYLHCAVSLCDSTTETCKPVCPTTRAGRNVGPRSSTSFDGTLKIGPIKKSGSIPTTPRPFSTTAATTPRPFSTTATTPRRFSTNTTPRPFATTAATTPGPFSTTAATTPRPFSTTTITTPQSGSSTITSAHIFWTLLIPALTFLIQSL